MWLSRLFGNIASMRSFQLGIIMLCSMTLTNCGNVTIGHLDTKNLQNLQQIALARFLAVLLMTSVILILPMLMGLKFYRWCYPMAKMQPILQ